MAPALLLALAALVAADPAGGAAQAEKSPLQGGLISPPTDDYSFVGWCYGAVAGYVDLYDKAMPEVERIERAWPTPSTEENIKIVYPGQRANAREQLKVFRAAMTAAEKASIEPIQEKGAAAIAKGRMVWGGAEAVTPAHLAQFWMSWTPPAKCDATAKALEERSNLLGQAIKYNVQPAPEPAAETPAADVAQAPAAPEAPAADEPVAAVDPTQAEPQIIRASTQPQPAEASDAIPMDEIDALLNAAPADNPAADEDIGP